MRTVHSQPFKYVYYTGHSLSSIYSLTVIVLDINVSIFNGSVLSQKYGGRDDVPERDAHSLVLLNPDIGLLVAAI